MRCWSQQCGLRGSVRAFRSDYPRTRQWAAERERSKELRASSHLAVCASGYSLCLGVSGRKACSLRPGRSDQREGHPGDVEVAVGNHQLSPSTCIHLLPHPHLVSSGTIPSDRSTHMQRPPSLTPISSASSWRPHVSGVPHAPMSSLHGGQSVRRGATPSHLCTRRRATGGPGEAAHGHQQQSCWPRPHCVSVTTAVSLDAPQGSDGGGLAPRADV